MSCESSCTCAGTGNCFSRFSKRYAKRFRKKGLEKVQRNLVEGIRRFPIEQKRVLDIGCGVGALHLTLLSEGAASATGIESSEGMIAQARKFAGEMGLTDKISYVHGDFVDLAGGLPNADITVLDKVVCCYENLDLLLERSTEKTKDLYSISHPRETLFVEMSFRVQIFLLKLFRASFHPFWHDWRRMKEAIVARGFRPIYEKPTFIWNVVVFQRV